MGIATAAAPASHLLGVTASISGLSISGGGVTFNMLDCLAAKLAGVFRVPCHVRGDSLAVDFAFDPQRGQFHSTSILQRMGSPTFEPDLALLGVASLDLYVPILTYVLQGSSPQRLVRPCIVPQTMRRVLSTATAEDFPSEPPKERSRPRIRPYSGFAALLLLALRDGLLL
jgi:hypothetical protein